MPHTLGVLEGVKTFWVREAHGDLPKNPNVLAAVHDLLQQGSTTALESQRPPSRGARAAAPYVPAATFEVDPPVVDELLRRVAPAGRRRGAPGLSEVEAARLEALMLRDYTGTPVDIGRPLAAPSPAAALPRAPRRGARRRRARAARRPRLRVEVVWGDITQAAGDVYAVGHYEGVQPQRAELALDEAVSGPRQRRHLVITDQTRRGILRGGLGDVAFFPVSYTHLTLPTIYSV